MTEKVQVTYEKMAEVSRHEAAHMVIASILGDSVSSVQVTPNGGQIDQDFDKGEYGLWTRLYVAVAGSVQDSLTGTVNFGSAPDMLNAQTISMILHTGRCQRKGSQFFKVEHYFEDAVGSVRYWLEEKYPDVVEKVAERIMKHVCNGQSVIEGEVFADLLDPIRGERKFELNGKN